MNSISIYLTGKERERLIDAVSCYIDTMSNGLETSETLDMELNDGLGKVMFKLYKGLQGEDVYKSYEKDKARYLTKENISEIRDVSIIKIEDIAFNCRVFNCLKKAGINTLGDLSKNRYNLRKIDGFGLKSLNSLYYTLRDLGLSSIID